MSTDRAAGPDRQLAGRYRLGRVLGSGGGGIVREGEDTLLRRRVAIKEVRLPPMASQAERDVLGERVLREARAAARLHHPGLVAVYDVLDAEDHPWIVMEYVDGPSLAEIIRESGRLAPERVARIGVGLAYALEAAHRAGVVHRDVKPGNVLVTSDGRARLTDFGIAVTEGDATLTSTGMLVGSPAYIAPERARGAGAIPAGDVWGLGATLFTAVEGNPPYAGEGALATLAAVVEDRRRPFQYCGPLRGVISELMDSDPARRPSLAAARRQLREIARALETQETRIFDEAAQPARRQPAQRTRGDRSPILGADPTAMDVHEVAAVLDHSGPGGGGVATRPGPDGAGSDGVGPDGAGADGAEFDGAGPDGAGPDGDPAGPEKNAGADGPDDGAAQRIAGTGPTRGAAEPSGSEPRPSGSEPESADARESRPSGGESGPVDHESRPSAGGDGRQGRRGSGSGRADGVGPPASALAGTGTGTGTGQDGSRRSKTVPLAVLAAVLVAAVAVTLSLVLTGGSKPSHPVRANGTTNPTTASSDPARASSPASTASSSASAAPSSAPSSTPVGSSAGPSGDTGATTADLDRLGGLIPNTTTPAVAAAGYTSHQAPGSWSAALPAGWPISDRGVRTTVTAPSGYPDLLIESQAKAGPSAIDAWQSQEPNVRKTSPGYRRLSIRPADGGDGTNAAVWEFTFTSGGRTIHVLDFGLVRNGHGYALRWRVPEDQWPGALSQMRTIFASFRPGP